MAKPLIKPEAIYDMALHLLDSEGLEGLSARKLSSALACSPNTLYQQVGKRDEMIARLLDYYFARQSLELDLSENWQRCAASWAGVTDWDRMLRHDRKWMSRDGRRRWKRQFAS